MDPEIIAIILLLFGALFSLFDLDIFDGSDDSSGDEIVEEGETASPGDDPVSM